jgi:phenylalanine-4-hydroxylase
MFVDREFCDFSQEIGLASLGASDDDITRLAGCYWYSVKFGLCQEDGRNKAYGAGLLSSFGELEYACRERSGGEGGEEEEDGGGERPEMRPWDPEAAANLEFLITKYQPVYFVANSLQDGKLKMRKYCEGLSRPFHALFNPQTETVHIDRPVRRAKCVPGSD